MSHSSAVPKALQQLIASDLDLQSRIQQAGNVTEVVEIVSAAAATNGLEIDRAALSAHLSDAVSEALAAEGRPLSDAELEPVAGGFLIEGTVLVGFTALMALVGVGTVIGVGGGIALFHSTRR